MNKRMQTGDHRASVEATSDQVGKLEMQAAVDTPQRRIWPGCDIPKGTFRKGLDEGLLKTDLINVYEQRLHGPISVEAAASRLDRESRIVTDATYSSRLPTPEMGNGVRVGRAIPETTRTIS